MAKIKLTKNEQKTQKDALKMYQRYLPTLTLKKQQLQSEIKAVFNISTAPFSICLAGSVFKNSLSMQTSSASWNRPIWFFTFRTFKPHLPPMAASTMASVVVGIR